LRHPTPDAIKLIPDPPPMWGGPPRGLLAAPGTYTVTLAKTVDGVTTPLAQPQSFEVVPLHNNTSNAGDPSRGAAFWRQYEQAVREHTAVQVSLAQALVKIERLQAVLLQSAAEPGELDEVLATVRRDLQDLDEVLNGNRSRQQPGEKFNPIIYDRLFSVARGIERSTQGPTTTHRRMLEIATTELTAFQGKLTTALDKLSALAEKLRDAGGPWLEGERL
jgi:hypothetical protein